MANETFYISNYLPPPAVTSREQVMENQRQLNANGGGRFLLAVSGGL